MNILTCAQRKINKNKAKKYKILAKLSKLLVNFIYEIKPKAGGAIKIKKVGKSFSGKG